MKREAIEAEKHAHRRGMYSSKYYPESLFD
jgi:hypothetical protein